MRLDSRFVRKAFMCQQRGGWEMYLGSSLVVMALEVVRVREQSMPRPRKRVLLQVSRGVLAISRRCRQCKRRLVWRSASVLRGPML